MKKVFRGLLVALLLGMLIPAVTARAEDRDQRSIAKGVFIGGVDVSGMSLEEAEAAVSAYVDKLSDEEITLSAGDGREKTFNGRDIGLYWSNTGIVEDAYALGHQGNIIQRYKSLKDLQRNNYTFDIAYGYENGSIERIVGQCAEAFDQDTVNCTLKKTENGFEVTEGQTGYIVDQEKSVNTIESFIQNGLGQDSGLVSLTMEKEEPLGSAEELSKVKDVLGTFTTSYKSSGASRSANVANGCRLINGSTIYPGEEFSVLDTITPFTQDNGYFPAGSYLNGLVVESIGGGICQVSTTLYNAVLLSELEVTERHNHSMIVNYVDPSADAAIAESGGKNFRFVNSTNHPIYIDGYTTEDKHITFTIYGVEERDPGRKVSYQSEVLETTPASADQYVTDPSRPVGYVGTQSAHLGYKAQLWKIVTENGQTTKEVVNHSSYKMVPRIVTVGTNGASDVTMGQLQAAMATGDINTVKSVAGALIAAQTAVGTENETAAAQAAADAVNEANALLQQQSEVAAVVAEAEAQEQDTAEIIQTD